MGKQLSPNTDRSRSLNLKDVVGQAAKSNHDRQVAENRAHKKSGK